MQVISILELGDLTHVVHLKFVTVPPFDFGEDLLLGTEILVQLLGVGRLTVLSEVLKAKHFLLL
jgi:hypothetical protein